MTDEETRSFERGDAVYGDDPFKGDEDVRPWLIRSNHEAQPFYGEQDIALIATSKLGIAVCCLYKRENG